MLGRGIGAINSQLDWELEESLGYQRLPTAEQEAEIEATWGAQDPAGVHLAPKWVHDDQDEGAVRRGGEVA
jgi:hypothetical protein